MAFSDNFFNHINLLIMKFIPEPGLSAIFLLVYWFFFIVPANSHLVIFFLSRCNRIKAIGQDIQIKNQKLKIKFVLAGWIENPIKSVVLTFPLDKIVFPTVTLCPRDSSPDRWGSVIKIFDQLNTDCGSKR